ncbi:DUF748 domain-containing protein [Allohahella sp. A8]|uniref:DUF748 domain-containing protein n=1 Tax=Allohahella sp. A8 TaxID=3141461 RepID=UPI003A80289C
MKPDTRLLTSQWYKSKLFWLLFVILLYALIGFFLVPYLIKNYTEDAIEQRFGWTGGPADVSFNPFEMSLEVNDFDMRDDSDRTIVSFSELYINFDLGSLYYWAWTLEPSHLNDLYTLVEIDESVQTNFGKAWAAHNKPAPEDQQDAGALPRILLKEIVLTDGRVEVIDRSQGSKIQHDISPIDLLVSDFVTYEGRDGRYVASITLGESQKVQWEGSIDAEPYRSNGRLELSGFNLAHLWPYVQPLVDYKVSSGRLDVGTSYVFSWQPDTQQALHLQVSDASAEISDLAVELPETKAFDTVELGTIGKMGLRGVDYDYNAADLDIQEAYLTAADLTLIRNAQSQINVAWPYTGMTNEADTTENQPSSADANADAGSFEWQIERIDLSDSRVTWIDRTLSNPANISVEKISAQMQGLSQNLDEEKAFSASMTPEQSGPVEIEGTIVPAKAKVETALSIQKLHVPLAQAYVSQFIDLQLNTGNLSSKGELVLTGDSDIGHFTGNIDVDDFDATDPLLKAELIGWKSLRTGPMRAEFAPAVVTIDTLTAIKPYGQFKINDTGETNFSALFPATPDAGGETPTDAPEASNGSSDVAVEPKAEINIARVLFENGRLYFEDNSIEPSVVLPMKSLGGAITGMSSRPDARSEVDIAGSVGEFGTVTIKGDLNALAEQLYLDLGLVVKNFHLTTVSPYAAKYIGRKIQRGQLRLNLDYKVEAGELNASNDIVIEEFSLGESVDSKEAIDLPVSLAIALLKDSNGTINLDVPVKGSLSDPNFALDKVIWNAFTNLLKTAVKSPFKLIGRLVGSGGDDIEKVDFEAGSSTLSETAKGSIQSLSTALKERPDLKVGVTGRASRAVDAPALAQSQLATEMGRRQLMGGNEIASYEDYLEAQGSELPKRTREADSDAQNAEAPQNSDAEYLALLKQAAEDSIEISDEMLMQLALERSKAVYQRLVETTSLDPAQISTNEPVVDNAETSGQEREGRIAQPFELQAR